ncbi:NDR1/HIN1-like protein 13 [Aristolochia californica]|uniref:NDR1/HIN1-like protein 13 n=1 Tax=Aristolochia californica TaxID=171875 RepID=UPI0035D53EF1
MSHSTPLQKEYKSMASPLYLLPPPPPPPPLTPSLPRQIIHPMKHQTSTGHHSFRSTTKEILLRPRRTNPFVWFTAFICVIFCLLLILAGISILVIFLVIKPRNPSFVTSSASLRSVYLDTPEYFNGDLIIFANFSNPNRKMDVTFEYLSIDLLFFERLISTQGLRPFTLRRGEARLEALHMISSEVYLPLNHSLELQKQVQTNRIRYDIRGTFRVRVRYGFSHVAYGLHGRCQMELTGPPNGFLVARGCRTKR